MKKCIFFILCFVIAAACNKNSGNVPPDDNNNTVTDVASQNITRAIGLIDKAIDNHFTGDGMAMARYYNPYLNTRSEEKGSVWMYTSAIEAVNSVLHALTIQKEQGKTGLYDLHFERYKTLLHNLYENADYYKGTFELTSYTQTKEWSVYGVDRGGSKGTARVEGIYNVYDDQQWLIREMLEAYKTTNNQEYLAKAEYLTDYVLDGWDCTLDNNGNEYGGITWGPGYTTKHACSNGPMVSPLVWLYELYKDKNDMITYLYIDTDQSRKTATIKKSDYYLMFAKKVYKWQKDNLFRADGVYYDMMGGCDPYCDVAYEAVNGATYRKHTNLRDKTGTAYSYNCGTMISGASDLYRVTNDSQYNTDLDNLIRASFSYFAKKDVTVSGYYTYSITGFNNWFNCVLLRGYVDGYKYIKASSCMESFQKNLDYGYDKFLYNGFLPANLLVGWSMDKSNNNMEGMFTFAFASEYGYLAKYELEKDK